MAFAAPCRRPELRGVGSLRSRLALVNDLLLLLDRLELAGGRADPVPAADGWELVLAENPVLLDMSHQR
jgi:hypothetical protein